jgi:hypothetical protein
VINFITSKSSIGSPASSEISLVAVSFAISSSSIFHFGMTYTSSFLAFSHFKSNTSILPSFLRYTIQPELFSYFFTIFQVQDLRLAKLYSFSEILQI